MSLCTFRSKSVCFDYAAECGEQALIDTTPFKSHFRVAFFFIYLAKDSPLRKRLLRVEKKGGLKKCQSTLLLLLLVWGLYQMFDEVGAVAWEHVDDGNLNHRVAGGLEAHRGAGHVDQYLTGEGRIVDLHVELQTLVLGLTADAFADS